METRHLRAFLHIAETRSISRAAYSLGLSQPSLSQQLLRLEDEVGVPLFHRSARGVIITEAGRLFQEHARQILRAEQQALEEVRQLKGEAGGQVILALPPSLARLAGVPLIEAMATQAPQVSLRLVESFTGTIIGWLERGKADLGVLCDAGSLRSLSFRPLAREALVLAGPPGRFAPGEAVAAASLAGLPLIAPGPQHQLRQLIDHEAVRLGLALDMRHEIDALGQITALVGAGHGLAILPLSALDPALSHAVIEGGAFRRDLCLVRNPAQVLTHASVRVEDIFCRVLADLIAAGQWRAEPVAALQ